MTDPEAEVDDITDGCDVDLNDLDLLADDDVDLLADDDVELYTLFADALDPNTPGTVEQRASEYQELLGR